MKYAIIAVVLVVPGLLILPTCLFVLSPQTNAKIRYDTNSLESLWKACVMYSIDNAGAFPPDFNAIAEPNYASHPKFYVCANDFENIGDLSNVMTWTSFVYNPNITTNSPDNAVLAYLPPGHYKEKNGGIILFASGKAKYFDLPDFTRTMNSVPNKFQERTSQERRRSE